MTAQDQTNNVQTQLDRAATALHAAATQQPQHVGAYLYCTRAVELLQAAGGRVGRLPGRVGADLSAEDDGVSGNSVQSANDSYVLIRLALTSLAGLPLAEFARDPVLAAARAARHALRLTDDPTHDPAAARQVQERSPGSGAGPTNRR